jgi:hypothetical protein
LLLIFAAFVLSHSSCSSAAVLLAGYLQSFPMCMQLPKKLCAKLSTHQLCFLRTDIAPVDQHTASPEPLFHTSMFGAPWRALQGSSDGSSNLQEAAGQGDLQTLQALLDSGIAVNSGDESGSTALHFAADRGQQEALQLLLAAGADVNAQDHDGQTPLHYAAACGQEKVGWTASRMWARKGGLDCQPDWPCKWPSSWVRFVLMLVAARVTSRAVQLQPRVSGSTRRANEWYL